MGTIVTVYSSKGGMGKSTISVLYALRTGAHYYTNDYRSGSEDLYKELIGQTKFHAIRPSDETLEIQEPAVIDLGGFISDKIPAILEVSSAIVIPIAFQSSADLRAFFLTVKAVEEINNSIILVVNNTKPELIAPLWDGINETFGGRLPLLLIRQSAFLRRLPDEGTPPWEINNILGAPRKTLDEVTTQLNALFALMGKDEHDEEN